MNPTLGLYNPVCCPFAIARYQPPLRDKARSSPPHSYSYQALLKTGQKRKPGDTCTLWLFLPSASRGRLASTLFVPLHILSEGAACAILARASPHCFGIFSICIFSSFLFYFFPLLFLLDLLLEILSYIENLFSIDDLSQKYGCELQMLVFGLREGIFLKLLTLYICYKITMETKNNLAHF